jgi:hypothetical protein
MADEEKSGVATMNKEQIKVLNLRVIPDDAVRFELHFFDAEGKAVNFHPYTGEVKELPSVPIDWMETIKTAERMRCPICHRIACMSDHGY